MWGRCLLPTYAGARYYAVDVVGICEPPSCVSGGPLPRQQGVCSRKAKGLSLRKQGSFRTKSGRVYEPQGLERQRHRLRTSPFRASTWVPLALRSARCRPPGDDGDRCRPRRAATGLREPGPWSVRCSGLAGRPGWFARRASNPVRVPSRAPYLPPRLRETVPQAASAGSDGRPWGGGGQPAEAA